MKQDQRIYRGGFVHRCDGNGITISITLGPLAQGEKTQVTTHLCNLPLNEEVEHCDTVDLYHFPGFIGARIQVTITTPRGIQEAWYTVQATCIEECSTDMWLDMVNTSDEKKKPPSQTTNISHNLPHLRERNGKRST